MTDMNTTAAALHMLRARLEEAGFEVRVGAPTAELAALFTSAGRPLTLSSAFVLRPGR